MCVSASLDMAQTDTETTGNFKSKKDRQSRKYGFACANCRKQKVRPQFLGVHFLSLDSMHF